MARRFPIGCPNDCPHLHSWDLSVDDWTHVCDKLEMQMDEYDYGYNIFPFCPLSDKEQKNE